MMRGLFGKKMPGVISGYGGGTFNMDGTQIDMRNVSTTAGGAFGNPMPMQEPQKRMGFWQGGDKFTGRDAIAGALAAIGDGLRGWAGGPTGAVESLMAGRMEPQRIAEEQRRRAAELAMYREKKGIDAEFDGPEAVRPVLREDNAGNVWAFDPVTGRPMSDRPTFVDPNERVFFQDGAMVRVPNRFSQAQQGGGYAEGTVIENDQGQRMILRNGQWQPAGGTGGNVGGNFR